MFTLYMKVVNSSQSVGFTKCRIIPAIYWMTPVFLKEFFQKVNFEKNWQTLKMHEKLPSMKQIKMFIRTALTT